MKLHRRLLAMVLGMGAALALVITACGGGEATATPPPPKPTAAPTVAPTAAPTTAPTAAPTIGPSPTPQPTATARPTATVEPLSAGKMTVALGSLGNFELLPFTTVSRPWLDAVYDYVIGADDDGKLDTSGVATSWQSSSDLKEWTVKLRQGATFHNGDKVTSADLQYLLQFAASEKSPYPGAGAIRSTVASVETPDESTAIVKLTGPSLFFPHLHLSKIGLGGSPALLLAKNYMEATGVEKANRAPVGSGPYKFVSLALGDRITLEAVPRHFYLGVPRTKSLIFRSVPEEGTRVALLKSAEVDLIQIGRKTIADIEKTQGLHVAQRKDSGVGYIRLEQQYAASYEGYGPNPFANVKVRQALSYYAIDRQGLVDSFLLGQGSPTMNFPLFRPDPGYQKMDVPPYDPAKARALLAEAGYSKGFEIDLLVFLHGTSIPETKEIMEALAVYWENVGIKVNRKPTEFANWVALIASKKPLPRPTVAGLLFMGLPGAPQASQYATTHRSVGLFSLNYDADLDAAAQAWGRATTLDEYIRTGREYQRKVIDAGCASGGCPLFLTSEVFGANATVPLSWKLGAATYSWQIERAAAQR